MRPAPLYVQRVISSSKYCSGVCTKRLVLINGLIRSLGVDPCSILPCRGGSAHCEAYRGYETVYLVRLLRDTDTISLASVTPPSRSCPFLCWSCILVISLVVS